MNKQIFDLALDVATSDILGALFDAAKWCNENGYKTPHQINIPESVYRCLESHPQIRNRLPIPCCFPPIINVYGLYFALDFNATEKPTYDVRLLDDYVTIEDALAFRMFK